MCADENLVVVFDKIINVADVVTIFDVIVFNVSVTKSVEYVVLVSEENDWNAMMRREENNKNKNHS